MKIRTLIWYMLNICFSYIILVGMTLTGISYFYSDDPPAFAVIFVMVLCVIPSVALGISMVKTLDALGHGGGE